MSQKYCKQNENYSAVERALSIALCELGYKNTEMVGLARYKTTYIVAVPKHFLQTAVPVLQKYINTGSIGICMEKAKKIALARKVRGWSSWSLGAVYACLPCAAIHIKLYLIAVLLLVSITSIIFLSRKIVANVWKNRSNEPGSDEIALEQMINMCKKNRLQLCMDYLMKR